MIAFRPYRAAALLLLGCAFLWKSKAQMAVPLGTSLDSVMDDLVGYRYTNQVLSPEEQRVAGMTTYMARTYFRDSTVAFTTLVSYYDRQTQGTTIHSPRNCLPGAGWEIIEGQPKALPGTGSTVNRYVIRNGLATAVVYYWYQGRGRVTANEYRVKWNLLVDASLKGHTEEALVRVVVPVPRTGAPGAESSAKAIATADAEAERIAGQLLREVDAVLPRGVSAGT